MNKNAQLSEVAMTASVENMRARERRWLQARQIDQG